MPNAYDYQTSGFNPGGIPFTKQQMLGQLALFLAYDTSWTVHKGTTNGSTGDTADPIVVAHDNGTPGDEVVIHIWETSSPNFGLNISTGNPGGIPDLGQNWLNQPGARIGDQVDSLTDDYHCRTRYGNASILEYYFFGYESYCYVIFRGANDIWRSFAFGHLDKLSAFNGGGFCCASWCTSDDDWVDRANRGGHTLWFDLFGPNQQDSDGELHCSQIRVDEPNGTLRYALGSQRYALQNFSGLGSSSVGRSYQSNYRFTTSGMPYAAQNDTTWWMGGFEHNKLSRSPTDFSNANMLVPVYVYMYMSNLTERDKEQEIYGQRMSPIAQLPHVYATRITNYTVGQEITVQGKTYTVFPYAKKTATNDTNDGQPNSRDYGFIIEKLEI